MNIPDCDFCKNEQTELGALVFSPPDMDKRCAKLHCCKKCYEHLLFLINDKLTEGNEKGDIANEDNRNH